MYVPKSRFNYDEQRQTDVFRDIDTSNGINYANNYNRNNYKNRFGTFKFE